MLCVCWEWKWNINIKQPRRSESLGKRKGRLRGWNPRSRSARQEMGIHISFIFTPVHTNTRRYADRILTLLNGKIFDSKVLLTWFTLGISFLAARSCHFYPLWTNSCVVDQSAIENLKFKSNNLLISDFIWQASETGTSWVWFLNIWKLKPWNRRGNFSWFHFNPHKLRVEHNIILFACRFVLNLRGTRSEPFDSSLVSTVSAHFRSGKWNIKDVFNFVGRERRDHETRRACLSVPSRW